MIANTIPQVSEEDDSFTHSLGCVKVREFHSPYFKESELMYLVYRFDGRERVLQVLECESLAMCKMYALTHTTAKGHTDILDAETGEVLYVVKGMGKDCFPKVFDTRDGKNKLMTQLFC